MRDEDIVMEDAEKDCLNANHKLLFTAGEFRILQKGLETFGSVGDS